MQEVTLTQMLEAREKRAEYQKALLSEYRCPLICFTMNIAGPQKTSPLIERAFKYGLELLENALSDKEVLFRKTSYSITGCEAYFSVICEAKALKEICTHIEESSHLGRLFDMDVISADDTKLERALQRGCIVCGASGRGCASRRTHTANELQATTNRIISDFFLAQDTENLARLAVKSLKDEVYTTPKPGLVDSANSGSHTDMDINTFLKSADALKPYFAQCFYIGQKHRTAAENDVFNLLRIQGIKAEKDMYRATGGINTHKGIIYSMGIICGAIGRLWRADYPFAKAEDIFVVCSALSHLSAEKDFEAIDTSTCGGMLYKTKGIRGIRGEAASGFPTVLNLSLPIYSQYIKNGACENDAGVFTLLHLISEVQDTNLYHRGGDDGVMFAKSSTRELLEDTSLPDIEKVKALDKEFIKRNLSPGGCADLLAITYFINSLQSL